MTDPRAAHDDDPFEATPSDLAALEADGDIDALLGIAKEARKGDLALARAAYEAAGRLGSGDALYAIALIRFQSGDEGTAKVSLREAADSGHLLARIHLANLYETGAVYTQDTEKATNWYRMAARSAGIDMDSEDGRRRLAELGGIRATRALDEAGALGNEEREKLLRKARLHGARTGSSRGVLQSLAELMGPATDGTRQEGSFVTAESDGRAKGSSPGDLFTLGDLIRQGAAGTGQVEADVAIPFTAATDSRSPTIDTSFGSFGPSRRVVAPADGSPVLPESLDILLILADGELRRGRPDAAAAALEKIIASYNDRRSKELAVVYQKLAEVLEAKGDQAGALLRYDSSFRIEPGNIRVLRRIGELSLRAGDLDRSERSFRALLLQNVDESALITRAEVFNFLGEVLRRRGDETKAKEMFQKALEAAAAIRAARQESTTAKAPAKAAASKAEPARKKTVTPRPKGHGSAVDGLFATLWTTLFAAGGLGAGFAVRAGVAELYAKGEAIPVYGTHAEYIFPSVALTVTFLPSFLFFRGATVLKSLPIGAIGYAIGVHLASGQMRVIPADLLPTVLGAAAFLGAALGFGLFGGAKPRPVAPVEL